MPLCVIFSEKSVSGAKLENNSNINQAMFMLKSKKFRKS